MRRRLSTFQHAPNPFDPESTIRHAVAARGPVRIEIFGVNGARVRTLVDLVQDAGVYTVRWNRTKNDGKPVGSGAYFYRLRAAGATDARKLILLK
jgi:flagellar hook assembly protein FlgD